MPRRQFVADLAKSQAGVLPAGITKLQAGDDDGEFHFFFTADGASAAVKAEPFRITACVSELSDYPKSHSYFLYAEDDAPALISEALQNFRGTTGKDVSELVDLVAGNLRRLSTSEDIPDEDDDVYTDDEVMSDGLSSMDELDGLPIDAFDDSDFLGTAASGPKAGYVENVGPVFRARLRNDIRAVKSAGFRVGMLKHQIIHGGAAYITVSIRMAKLNISPEAMRAWQVEPNEYLIMIINYPSGYRDSEELQKVPKSELKNYLGFRVVAGPSYKPPLEDAVRAFSSDDTRGKAKSERNQSSSAVRNTFISKPLSRLLETSLLPVLNIRSLALPWHGAEAWYADLVTGMAASELGHIPPQYFEPEIIRSDIPAVLKADHFPECPNNHSLPLLAMQFMLRHFVRCTEFCLVCHRKIDSDVEAIKPYVCERNLCLYQYMTLGFGPNLEHEIATQPYVVDLLVSFCYASAQAGVLKDLPDGLALLLPPLTSRGRLPMTSSDIKYLGWDSHADASESPTAKSLGWNLPAEAVYTSSNNSSHQTYQVRYDPATHDILFLDKLITSPISAGTWILIVVSTEMKKEFYCRVRDANFFPKVELDEPVEMAVAQRPHSEVKVAVVPSTASPAKPIIEIPAVFAICNQDIEQLDIISKQTAICRVLDTLPSVKEMREYVSTGRSLKQWVERIMPSALSLLTWIIASNRACLIQVDSDYVPSDQGGTVSPERVYGMSKFLQFRFAMGAPDKEQRFLGEVKSVQERLQLQYPTLFAWHGSPLHNWHMIIREGLHYNKIVNGRAYGHGVYHAKDAGTSLGYTRNQQGNWPNSALGMSGALALSEIVNAPQEYVNTNPYYVVSQLDWIQTRYLFVKASEFSDTTADVRPADPHLQDPACTPRGATGEPIVIPAFAIKSSRLGPASPTSNRMHNPFKKQKFHTLDTGSAECSPTSGEFDAASWDAQSIATEDEDLELLIEEENSNEAESQRITGPSTDFVPGSLDFDNLPLMAVPEYASPQTTRQLMQEIKALSKVQKSTSLGELGWYIDFDRIENIYQWIVELHSFHLLESTDTKLPLVADMKKQKITSIVFEVRFNGDFPFSPPYVRVIRPRFLTLAEGGGGHIVQGGAMCMELLTNTGWSSVSSLESVLLQVRMAMISHPPARLAPASHSDYGAREGADGYLRACRAHGWAVPPGFHEMSHQSTLAVKQKP
jgi:ubiquitin-conjugating enzyme E2 Q